MHILSIKPEMILFFFMFSCLALLVFNILYIFADKAQIREIQLRHTNMAKDITAQINRISQGDSVDPDHLIYLKKRLKWTHLLKIFEQAMETAMQQLPEKDCRQYLIQLRPVFLMLTATYHQGNGIKQSYFLYIIAKFEINRGQSVFDGIIDYCLDKISSKESSLRENSLKALYSIGNIEAILAAWDIMENKKIVHHNKLLADGLLTFSGDRDKLAQQLFQHGKDYHDCLFLPVLQFIYYYSADYQKGFLYILEDETADKELQLLALRYLRKYPYEPARKKIQSLLGHDELVDWEYTAVAAHTLSGYPGPDTIECLKKRLSDTNWYIRLNSAETLINGLKVPQVQLHDIYNGQDRFSKEILYYVTSQTELVNQEMELIENYV